MEIAKISSKGIRVKTKIATIALSPFDVKGKVFFDCILLYDKKNSDFPSFEINPLIIDGPGEYEIKGVKLNGINKKDTLQYYGRLDGIDIVFVQGSTAQKGKEMVQECQIAVIDADTALDQSTIAAFGANAVVLYGEYAKDTAQKIGKDTTSSTKYVLSKDKLPADLEVILLE